MGQIDFERALALATEVFRKTRDLGAGSVELEWIGGGDSPTMAALEADVQRLVGAVAVSRRVVELPPAVVFDPPAPAPQLHIVGTAVDRVVRWLEREG